MACVSVAGAAQRPESVRGRRGPCPLSSLPGTLNFRMKFCHSTGIARSGGGVRVRHDKLCLVRALIPQVTQSNIRTKFINKKKIVEAVFIFYMYAPELRLYTQTYCRSFWVMFYFCSFFQMSKCTGAPLVIGRGLPGPAAPLTPVCTDRAALSLSGPRGGGGCCPS